MMVMRYYRNFTVMMHKIRLKVSIPLFDIQAMIDVMS